MRRLVPVFEGCDVGVDWLARPFRKHVGSMWCSCADLGEVEKAVRLIVMEGLHWGGADRVPVAFGVFKLRMVCTIVDDLVSADELQESTFTSHECHTLTVYRHETLTRLAARCI